MSNDQTQNVYRGGTLGRRIKFLRGELSQNEFAKKVGVSRAALANYETGRTIPGQEVIEAISNAFGITASFLSSGKAHETDRMLDVLGLNDDRGRDLTPEEWAIVRGLRACRPDIVLQIVSLIAESYVSNRNTIAESDPLLLGEDLRKLVGIVEKNGQYQKGADQDNKTERFLALARRLVDLNVEVEHDRLEGSQ